MGLLSPSFDPNKDIPSLAGKTYILIGGSAGIGFGIAAHILQHEPAALYLLGKKHEHLEEAHEALKEYGDVSVVHPIQIELEDLSQTASVAKSLFSKLTSLDGLILNAGLGVRPYSLSADGIDTHMQVNVLSQHLLFRTLLPLLQNTPGSRVVLQSSDLHRGCPSSTKFESLAEINQDIGPANLYNRTKLAQILLVRKLYSLKAQSLLGLSPNAPPYINATHPGAVNTAQPEQAVEAYGTLGKIGVKAVRPFMKDPIDEGCRPALFAATSVEVEKEGIDGAYIVPDCKVTDVSSQAKNEELQENLWRLVESVLKDKLKSELPYEAAHSL